MDDKRVLVAVRVRPKLESAINATQNNERYHMEAAAKTSDNSVRLSDGKTARDAKTHNFSFDMVFDKDSTQLDVYEETTLDAVDAVLQGCSATVITYGQTGSGKTYTVLGAVKKNPLTNDIITGDTGLFLRALKDILTYADNRANDIHLVIGLSVIEIYLDDVRDLLSTEREPPTVNVSVIRDTLVMPNLTYKPINDLNDAVQAYKLANDRRVSRATAANDTSSRSHAVFSIEIFQQQRTDANPEPLTAKELCTMREKQQIAANTTPVDATGRPLPNASMAGMSSAAINSPTVPVESLFSSTRPGSRLEIPGQPPVYFSKLVLTDLAGSEKFKNSKVRAEGFEELKRINASLTALGNVVHSLYEGARHIPYRDSKLTIVLRDAFAAASSKIVMIANVSPTVNTFDETLSTMFFADKVKGMKVENPQSAEVAKMEVEYLNTMRVLEEIAADLRVAMTSHDYPLSIRRFAAPTAVNRPLALTQRLKEKELKAQVGEASLALARSKQEARKKQVELESASLGVAVKNESVDTYKKTRAHLEVQKAELATSRTKDEADYNEFIAEVQESITKDEHAALQLESERCSLQPRRAELPTLNASTSATLETLEAQVEEMEHRILEANREHEDSWAEAQRIHALQKKQWAASMFFAEGCNAMWTSRLEYSQWRRENIDLLATTENVKRETENADVTHWIRSAVIRIARNAVVTGISKARRAPQTRPASKSLVRTTSSRRDPEAGLQSPSEAEAAPEAQTSKRAGTKQRQGTLFDQPTLIKDIINYVQFGCNMLKYGRSGAPHYRFFYVIMPDGEDRDRGEARLCWDDDATGNRSGKGSSVVLNSVTKVILGQFTPVFTRTTGNEGFYNSFSLEYIHKQQPRTLDVVCDTDAEMESWVIAMCHLSRRNPLFGGPMSSSRYIQSLQRLEPQEQQLCTVWHIPPDVLISVRRRIEDARARSRGATLRVSPGDVRLLSSIDIFRSCAIWAFLNRLNIVENPFERLYSYLSYEDDE